MARPEGFARSVSLTLRANRDDFGALHFQNLLVFPRHFMPAGHSLALKLRYRLFSLTHCRTLRCFATLPGSNPRCSNGKNKNATQGDVFIFILARPEGFEPSTF